MAPAVSCISRAYESFDRVPVLAVDSHGHEESLVFFLAPTTTVKARPLAILGFLLIGVTRLVLIIRQVLVILHFFIRELVVADGRLGLLTIYLLHAHNQFTFFVLLAKIISH